MLIFYLKTTKEDQVGNLSKLITNSRKYHWVVKNDLVKSTRQATTSTSILSMTMKVKDNQQRKVIKQVQILISF